MAENGDLNCETSYNNITKRGSKEWVKLNVGGTCFLTTKTTLAKDPNSFLNRLVQEDSDLISDRVRTVKFNINVIYILFLIIIL